MRITSRTRNAIVGAGIALAMAVTPAAAGAQAATPDPVTAAYTATYQRQCTALNRSVEALPGKIRNIRRTARSEREAIVRARRILTTFIGRGVRRLRVLAVATAPPQFASFQATYKADFKRDRPFYRRTTRALARVKTQKALNRATAKLRATSRTNPRPPAALRSAAPACRKAL